MSKQTRRTTIEDVANHAGVGKVTVSYVLNGRSKAARISTATQERVMNSATELNYRPNALARSLVQQRTDIVAVTFQYASYFSSLSGFTSEVMRGVCAACVDRNLDVMLHTKPSTAGADEVATLMDGRVDGVLVLRDRNDPTLLAMAAQQFPCVLFFCRGSDPTMPFVDCDNYLGGRMAAQHLLDLGHTDIAFLAGPDESNAAADRLLGFQEALLDAKIKLRSDRIFRTDEGSHAVDKLVQVALTDDRPTALFSWSDEDALKSMTALVANGFSLPDEMSIVGFDSSDPCERMTPPLTSVRQPIYEMAYQAVDLLVKIIRKEEVDRSQHIFSPQLDLRKSTCRMQETVSRR